MGADNLLTRSLRSVIDAGRDVLDADRMLQRSMAMFIELAASRYALDAGATWKPGEPLKLLLAGYSGTRNTGADVRVEEMIRQFRHLFGDDEIDLSLLTIDPALSRGYFRTVKQLHLPQVYPRFLFETVHRQHGVIACEGSMFKSKFANALATMMVGALGLASAEQKLAIGYGGEAGAMDPALEDLVRKYCGDALIITRNTESQAVLARLGVKSEPGTDTAWTFDAAPPDVGRAMLESAGWNGRTPVLVLCPINPFWWPVKPDLIKGVTHAITRAHDESHYDSIYFHHSGDDVREKQARYIAAIAEAVRRFRATHEVFPVLVGMEQLDRRACDELDRALGGNIPRFVSDEHDMYRLVSLLRCASMLVASRYHAVVTSMPAGVPSAGITMDERLRNLMTDREQPELALEVDDPNLAERLHTELVRLHNDGPAIRNGIERCVVKNLVRMGHMGRVLVEYVRSKHPELRFRSELGTNGSAWAHLPPLSPALDAICARHATTEASVLQASRAKAPQTSRETARRLLTGVEGSV